MLGLDTGMQSVTMQHISSKDIPVEDIHPPSVCVLPPKAVSSFPLFLRPRLFDSHIPRFLIHSCFGGVFVNMHPPLPSFYPSCLDTACRRLRGTSVTGISMPHWLYLNALSLPLPLSLSLITEMAFDV